MFDTWEAKFNEATEWIPEPGSWLAEEEGKQRGWGCVHDSCGEDRARCLHNLDQTIEVRTRDRRTALRGLVRVRVRGCGVRDLRLGLEAPLCYVSGSRACGDGWCLRLVALT